MASPGDVERLEARIDTLEQSGRYDEAIAVLAELEELTGEDQRWHVAWMHVLAGRRGESDVLWAALEREHPGDPTVAFLAGNAHAEAQEPEIAAELVANAPLSVRGNKRVLRALLAAEATLDPAVEAELIALRKACFASEDLREGVRAFGEKRPARWRGR